ncbi:hypothetical protein L9F63_023299, partial [Diploptera punctata]
VPFDDGLPQHESKPKIEFAETDETLKNIMGFVKSSNEKLSVNEGNKHVREFQTDVKSDKNGLHDSNLQMRNCLILQEDEVKKELNSDNEELLPNEQNISKNREVYDEGNNLNANEEEALKTVINVSEMRKVKNENNTFSSEIVSTENSSTIKNEGNGNITFMKSANTSTCNLQMRNYLILQKDEIKKEINSDSEELLANEQNISKDQDIFDDSNNEIKKEINSDGEELLANEQNISKMKKVKDENTFSSEVVSNENYSTVKDEYTEQVLSADTCNSNLQMSDYLILQYDEIKEEFNSDSEELLDNEQNISKDQEIYVNDNEEEILETVINVSKIRKIKNESNTFSSVVVSTESFSTVKDESTENITLMTSVDTSNNVSQENSETLKRENLFGKKRLRVSKIAAPMKRNKSEFLTTDTNTSYFEYANYEEGNETKNEVKVNRGNKQDRKYRCLECGKSFMTHRSLKAHQILHESSELEELVCKVCKGEFLFKEDLILHIGTHSNDKFYSCDLCAKIYRSNFRLRMHKRSHFPPSFSCKKCDKTFHLKSILNNHKKVHSENRFTCDICGKSLSTKSILEGHLRMHEGIKPYQCQICGKRYQSFDCLRLHKLRHRGARFFCEICGKGTKDKTGMKVHMNTHTRELACKCPICLKTFANGTSRSKHLKSICTDIVCIVCGDKFDTVKILVDHRTQQHGVEEIEKAAKECRTDSILYCETCCLYIARVDQMAKHMLNVHDLEHLFKCKQCLKCFLSESDLEAHVTTCSVSKVRKLTNGGKCVLCSKVLDGANEIMKHMRSVHKDYKPYLCEMCPKSFLTNKQLEKHSKCHFGKERFICLKCGWNFRYSHTLRQHWVHQETNF